MRRLPDDFGRLRYRFENAAPVDYSPHQVGVGDLDLDGVDEEIRIVRTFDGDWYMEVRRPDEGQRFSLMVEYLHGRSGLSDVLDLTGDGVPEIIYWDQTPEGVVALSVLGVAVKGDAVEREVLGTVSWDVSESVRPGGHWAGDALVRAAFDLDGNGSRESLLLSVSTGLGLKPRGVWRCNWEAGDVGWQLPTGATPTGSSALADLDGDGAEELIIGLESPGNGAAAGEWDDGHAYVVAIDREGNVLWWRELGGYSIHVDVALADLDGDGSVDVVTAVKGHSEASAERFGVQVWRGGDGILIAEEYFGSSINAIAARRCPEGGRIFAGAGDGRLMRLRLEGAFLEIEGVIDCRDPVLHLRWAAFEPPLAGGALFAVMGGGTVALFDERLRPLAAQATDDTGEASYGASCCPILPARFGLGAGVVRGVVAGTGDKMRLLYAVRSPLPAWLKILSAVAAAIGAAACVPRARRVAISVLRRWLLPREGRGAAVDELLAMLATASHGKLAATSTLRRLCEQLVMVAGSDGTPPPAFGSRYREAIGNVRDLGLPTVARILEEARRLGVSPRSVAIAAECVGGVRDIIGALPTTLPERPVAEDIRTRLVGIVSTIVAELDAIKRACERERSTVLATELGRAIASRSADATACGAALVRPDPGGISTARVVGTPPEVAFALENLLANAIEALKGEQDRRIDVSLRIEGAHAVVTVTDTGRGIPGSRHQDIFLGGASEKVGGGYGLSRSREILGRRGGSIGLVRSAPGEGAVFEARFRLCR